MVKTCIITGFGINADLELQTAFELAGSEAERIHINDLIRKPEIISTFHIIGFPGGCGKTHGSYCRRKATIAGYR